MRAVVLDTPASQGVCYVTIITASGAESKAWHGLRMLHRVVAQILQDPARDLTEFRRSHVCPEDQKHLG
jgi:hypothetical protein